MNMPPPHGPGGHHGHPGVGASPSPSPGMMNRPHPHAQQFIPQHPQQHYLDSPTPASNRGRKRKLTSQHLHPHQQQHLVRRPSMHGPHPHGYPGGHQQHPQAVVGRPPQPPFLGLNLPPTIADEMPESIFDDLDRLTTRDISVARYARNHELMSMVFDARRIDTLTPAPSPYADVSAEDLKGKVKGIYEEVERLEKEHEETLRLLREGASTKKAGQGNKDSSAEDGQQDVPVWGENASRGRILGVGFVRAETPEEIRPPKHAAGASNSAEGAADAEMEPAQSAANEASDAAAASVANGETAEPEEAVRRQAEREAIEKLNLELGITQPAEQEKPPAPAPASVPAVSTPIPTPAGTTATSILAAEAAATGTQPSAPAAPAPVLAPAQVRTEAASADADTAVAAPSDTTATVAAEPAAEASTDDDAAAAVVETAPEAVVAAEGAAAVPTINAKSESVGEAIALQTEAADVTMAESEPVGAPVVEEVAQAGEAVHAPVDAVMADKDVAAVADSAPEASVDVASELPVAAAAVDETVNPASS